MQTNLHGVSKQKKFSSVPYNFRSAEQFKAIHLYRFFYSLHCMNLVIEVAKTCPLCQVPAYISLLHFCWVPFAHAIRCEWVPGMNSGLKWSEESNWPPYITKYRSSRWFPPNNVLSYYHLESQLFSSSENASVVRNTAKVCFVVRRSLGLY